MPDFMTYPMCTACAGLGRIEVSSLNDGESEWIADPSHTIECPFCGGNGYDPDYDTEEFDESE